MEFSFTFLKILLWGLYLVAPVIILLLSTILILGLVAGRIERWQKFDSLYWALITALTVGYGDIRPVQRSSRMISIVIGTLGIMLAGILVAITVEATSVAFREHVDADTLSRVSAIKQ